MRWRTRSQTQSVVSMLPPAALNELYYRVQRACGALRRPVPLRRLSAGVAIWRRCSVTTSKRADSPGCWTWRGAPMRPSQWSLNLCGIDYRAPADAARTGLPAATVDFHTSYTTFEHILRDILEEGARILRPGGRLVHRFDYTDHFSRCDRSRTAITFLQYSDEAWDRIGGNRYMYMNRLRHDDSVDLFEEAALRLAAVEPDVDDRRPLVSDGRVTLDPAFRGKSTETLATTAAWFVAAWEDAA